MGIFGRGKKQPLSDTIDPTLQRVKNAIQSMKLNRGNGKELRDGFYAKYTGLQEL